MPRAKLTSKGRLTVPKESRDLLQLGSRDHVDFVVTDDGTVVLRPATAHVRELQGFLHRKDMKPLSVDQMNAVIRRHVTRRS